MLMLFISAVHASVLDTRYPWVLCWHTSSVPYWLVLSSILYNRPLTYFSDFHEVFARFAKKSVKGSIYLSTSITEIGMLFLSQRRLEAQLKRPTSIFLEYHVNNLHT